MNAKTDFFQVGGPLDEDSHSYVERTADTELLAALERGELCLVLAPRQTGKSSLMVNARARLRKAGISAGIVDFQPLGSHRDPSAWFRDMVFQIERSLQLTTDTLEWWETHDRLGATQRFMTFIEDVVLGEIQGRVIIFFDEIDSVLSLPFSDDFFTTIRALFNARASNPNLKRVSFVLLGLATPSEFVKSRSRTPFNIGREIELRDFDSASLGPFIKVLGTGSEPLVDRIFYWTAGQPLMVQKLAEAVYSWADKERTPERLDKAVQETYIDTKIEKDTHLKFIRDYLLEDNKKLRKTLKTYRSVLEDQEVTYDDQSLVHGRLKLTGVVRVDGQRLVPRNRIYQKVFDRKWVKENTPRDVTKMVAYGASAALVLVLVWFFLIQPLFLPRFSRFGLDGALYYTDEPTMPLSVQLPEGEITKITLDGELVPSSGSPDARKPAAVEIDLENLPVGPSEHRLRLYGRLWKENFQARIILVFYPMSQWKPLTDLEMVGVAGGCFEMGCGDWDGECSDDEKPVHRVCLDGFEIGRTEVTQDQWKQIMGYDPSSFKNEGNNPVERVSWDDVQEFIRRLNQMAGKRFRLPTEAEWEFAARSGGKPEKYAGGDNLDKLGWYGGNSKNATHPVGQKLANGLGIYDMSGNVWEWCQDWYAGDYYKNSPEKNPQGPETGTLRVVRGGSWGDVAFYCRSAYRFSYTPAGRIFYLGFRLARSVTLGP